MPSSNLKPGSIIIRELNPSARAIVKEIYSCGNSVSATAAQIIRERLQAYITALPADPSGAATAIMMEDVYNSQMETFIKSLPTSAWDWVLVEIPGPPAPLGTLLSSEGLVVVGEVSSNG